MPFINNCLSGLLACSLVLTGGLFGVPQKDYDALKAENEALKAQLEAVRAEYADFVNRTPAAIAELILSGGDPAAELEAASQTQYVETGASARIETETGVYVLNINSVTVLPAESWIEERYLINWEVYNESFVSKTVDGVLIYPENFLVSDANGYICSTIYSAEDINNEQVIPPGKRCISQACWRIVNPDSEYLEISLPSRVTFKIPVEK